MSTLLVEELLARSRRLLDAVDRRDWATYAELCDPTLTAHEPEALGQRVEGLEFHRFYFGLEHDGRPVRSEICTPHVRVVGEAAIVAYVRVVQTVDAAGAPVSRAFEETRVWHKAGGDWKHVHFHRSQVG